jgi:hypothetical protein
MTHTTLGNSKKVAVMGLKKLTQLKTQRVSNFHTWELKKNEFESHFE